MKIIFKILIALTTVVCFISATNKTHHQLEKIDYNQLIKEYLDSKKIQPTITFNNDGRKEFNLLNHKISWLQKEKGIEINIDGITITTKDKVTLNKVMNSGVDSVNFANFLQQVKIYEGKSLVGFVLTNTPCTGLGCSVNYQIIYDLKTGNQSYFGRFRTGFEFELYNFNSQIDNKPDYLSKTFIGRNIKRIDTTEFVMYSQTKKGSFKEFKTDNQDKFWFKHSYSEFHSDLDNEMFEEKWITQIVKNGR